LFVDFNGLTRSRAISPESDKSKQKNELTFPQSNKECTCNGIFPIALREFDELHTLQRFFQHALVSL
jgi:hypothetical protein